MKPFDPDAYLASPAASSGGFDPDAYLAQETIPGPRKERGLVGKVVEAISSIPFNPIDLQRRLVQGTIRDVQAIKQAPTDYQTYRQLLTPTVEALGSTGGAIAGGVAGSTLGPAGTVAGGIGGGGLGLGIAREALQLADQYFGGKAPRTPEQLITQPIENIREGMTQEAAGRVIGPVVSKVAGKIADFKNIPTNKAADIARKALGPDLEEAKLLLRQADEGLTAGQATAGLNSPTWQALIERALQRDPRFLNALSQSQGDVSLNSLAKLVGGPTATEMRGATDLAKQTLTDITSPARQASLTRANMGQRIAEFEKEAGALSAEAAEQVQKVRDLVRAGNIAEAAARLEVIRKNIPVGFAKYTYKGELAKMADNWASQAATGSLDLGQGARFAQSAAESLRKAGIKPLRSDELIGNLRGILRNPEFAGNPEVAESVKQLMSDISQWTNSGGIIDAVALDALRKNSVNAAIARLRPGVDATTQRNLASSVMSNVKPLIIDAIESAGGQGYRQYLGEYAEGMQKIAQQKLTGKALDLWKSNKDEFVRLVQGESPEVVERILGPGKYDIAKELADDTMATLRTEANKVLRDQAVKSQADMGKTALIELMRDNVSKFRFPSLISSYIAATNKGLEILENKIGKATMSKLTQGLKNGQSAVQLLETLPVSERNRVLKLLADPKQWSGVAVRETQRAVTAPTNTLAPENDNRNALAR